MTGEPGSSHSPSKWARRGRLILKELRETLRDRRTILTLLLMPILAYPLLGVAFQRLLITQIAATGTPEYFIAFPNIEQNREFERIWSNSLSAWQDREAIRRRNSGQPASGPQPTEATPAPSVDPSAAVTGVPSEPMLTVRRADPGIPEPDVEALLARGLIDVGIVVDAPPMFDSEPKTPGRVQLIYVDRMPRSVEAYRFVLERLDALNSAYLRSQARAAGMPTSVNRISVRALPAASGSSAFLASLVPLVLLLMTVTGAVYPAIDLTAGERERHTLETLIAAPISRISVLFAKYVAVVTVAILTATVNVIAMLLTMQAVGLEKAIFGDVGITLKSIVGLFGLLCVFATFFSAVLLCLTSIARSFKEAQAYLIPLMLLSLAPGVASLIPGVELGSAFAVVPLLNMVLLAKETVLGSATLGLTAVVVGSTLLYGVAALSLAARWFGSDAVLSGSTGGWSDLFRRPESRNTAIKPEIAYGTVAAIFPVFFLTGSLIGRMADLSIESRLALNALLTAAIFGGIPAGVALWRRVPLANAFQLRRSRLLALLGAVVAGAAAWPLAHEVVLLLSKSGLSTIGTEQLERAHGIIEAWKNVPFAVRLICIAIVPAIFEELCFRGFLLGAIRRRTAPWAAVLITALAFGLFHILVGGTLAIERLAPSTLLGLALGWIALRTGSVFPGIVFHILNNGTIVALAEYEQALKDKGWDVSDQQHLPPAWLVTSAACVIVGLTLVWAATRSKREQAPAPPISRPLENA
ncbi:ABC-2 family transporter protein [Caulifigura coniformis]|uniref:ABC-2 family transporter protein n=1 Tax=Caulifigura coniformis TaxID=2527983 RepID=A0A517S8J7_9PLAN|nr:ABC transporter permease subunit/CPBP intramembrane protease [Caulifigura coniformis]QDT52445.1 ABC-2 family transporter protein [Caulifigura coniformis]